MIPRSTLNAMARVALAATLFTQAVLVFAACESAWRAPARVITLAEQRMDGENCHEQAINVNLCLAHCLGGDQSLDIPFIKVPALCAAPVLCVPVLHVAPHDECAPPHLGVPPAATPPPRILFQSLRI